MNLQSHRHITQICVKQIIGRTIFGEYIRIVDSAIYSLQVTIVSDSLGHNRSLISGTSDTYVLFKCPCCDHESIAYPITSTLVLGQIYVSHLRIILTFALVGSAAPSSRHFIFQKTRAVSISAFHLIHVCMFQSGYRVS